MLFQAFMVKGDMGKLNDFTCDFMVYIMEKLGIKASRSNTYTP